MSSAVTRDQHPFQHPVVAPPTSVGDAAPFEGDRYSDLHNENE